MRTTAAVALLALVLAANATLPPAAAKADAPTLAAGDYFDQRSTTSTSGVTVTSTSHTLVQGVEKVSVGGVAYDAVKLVTTSATNSTTSGFTTTSNTTSTSWVRTTDGATLKGSSSTTSSYTIPGVGPQVATTTSETTYDRPCETMRWPFDVADAWSTTCYYNTTTTANGVQNTNPGTLRATTKVDRTESVTVPAGTLSTLVLLVTYNDASTGTNSTTTQWYAPAACTNAKTTSGSGANTVTIELTAFRCAAVSGGSTTTTTTTSTTTSTTSTTTTSTTPPTDGTTTTTTQQTSTTTTPTATSAKTGVPGPALVMVLAAVAGIAVLAAGRRAR